MTESKSIETEYYLYIDECGDHNLVSYDKGFPIFTLCGILIAKSKLHNFEAEINKLKEDIWGDTDVIFHSTEIRKHQKRFVNLNNAIIREKFYNGINAILGQQGVYVIVCCAIPKEPCITTKGTDIDVYGIALSYVLQRCIFYLDDNSPNSKIRIVVEKRGKKEDKRLLDYYNKIIEQGIKYCSEDRLKNHIKDFNFAAKYENIIGLQIADLIAYPISRYVLYPEKPNPAYEVVKGNIYVCEGKSLGLKIFPD